MAVVEASPDRESHEYKRFDIYGCEEDKKFFEGALAWDLSVDGRAWADGKNVSAPFLTIVMTIECTDSYLPTHSSSQWEAINDRAGCLGGFLALRRSLSLWIRRVYGGPY